MVPNLHISRNPIQGEGATWQVLKRVEEGGFGHQATPPRNNGSQGLSLQKKVLVFREQWVLGTITGIFQGGVCGGAMA